MASKPAVFVLSSLAFLACSAQKSGPPAVAPASAVATSDAHLPHLARTIRMPDLRAAGGGIGRLDHLAYDPRSERLFLAAVGCDSLEVLDLRSGKHLRTISGVPEPQGLAIVPGKSPGEAARVFLGCGGDGKVRAYDAATLASLGAVFAGDDCDNLRWDPRTGRIVAGCGTEQGGALTALDPQTLEVVGRIALPAHAEGFRLDDASARLFVNVPGAKRASSDGLVLCADRERGVVEATWQLHDAARNFPLAFVPEHHVVLIACRSPAVLLALDEAGGEELGRIPCVDSDDLFFDAQSARVFVIGSSHPLPPSGAAGADSTAGVPPPAVVQVLAMPARGVFRPLGVLPLPAHARTGLLVPERRALYVAVPVQADGTEAEIREYALE